MLEEGQTVTPGRLALLAALGEARIDVHRRPRVSLIPTGDELVEPGEALGPGQIHDSNAPMLRALATAAGAQATTRRLPDDRSETERGIAAALDEADLLLLSGGVSVGPHDHVKPALKANAVALCEVGQSRPARSWKKDKDLMAFLKAL